MRVLRRRAVIITLFAVAVTPVCAAPAGAADESRDPWATVNVCDTDAAPNTIGIRASVPGVRNGSEERYLRFVVQYFSREDARWYRIAEGGDSGFLPAGKGRKARQQGRSFRIEPMPGQPVQLRGRVFVQWRVKERVVRSASALTRKGHRSSAGDDPAGYSAATCTITA